MTVALSSGVSLIDVALPLPLFRTFTYRVPPEITGSVTPGSRVVVPFRNRKEIGIVVGVGEATTAAMKVKDLVAAPDDAPGMDEPMLVLCRWIAEYYITPLGVALRTALPAALTGVDVPVPVRKTRRVAQIRQELPSLMRRDNIFARAPQQRALYELLETLGGRAAIEHLAEQLHFSTSVLKGLVARGLVEIGFETVERDPFLTRAQRAPETHLPSDAQAHALERLAAAPPGPGPPLPGGPGRGGARG